jgi:Ca2+-binding RTX toxin-like protein
MPLRLRHLALVTLLISLSTATAAQAAITASYEPRDYFNGQEEDPDEYVPAHVELIADDAANTISLQKSGSEQVTISDPGGITAAKGCTQASASSVTCPLPDYVRAELAGGSDSLTGGEGVTLAVEAGAGNDTVTGYGGPVFGEGIDDDPGGVLLSGGEGDDVLTGTDIGMSGGDGDDTVTALGSKSNFILYGDGGKDELTGGAGGDVFYGGAGNDDLKGGGGNDRLDGDGAGAYEETIAIGDDDIDGGDGLDRLTWDARTSAVTVDLSKPAPAGQAGEKDKLSNIENITTGSGADTITGTDGANRITPGGGIDTVDAGDGDDFLGGGDTAADSLDLGAGNDTISYESLGKGTVDVDLSDPGPDGPAAGKDTLTGVENVVGTMNGSKVGDRLVGDEGPNLLVGLHAGDRLEGGGGDDLLYGDRMRGYASFSEGKLANDRISGGAGNDLLDGGVDNDSLDGGLGDDTIDGAGLDRGRYGGIDIVDYSSRKTPITARVGAGGGEAGEKDRYIRVDGIRGGSGKDKLTGRKKKADRLFGGPGADVLNALSGKDRVSGDAGRDRITANDGQRDRVNCGAGRDRVRADRKDRLTACE